MGRALIRRVTLEFSKRGIAEVAIQAGGSAQLPCSGVSGTIKKGADRICQSRLDRVHESMETDRARASCSAPADRRYGTISWGAGDRVSNHHTDNKRYSECGGQQPKQDLGKLSPEWQVLPVVYVECG